MIAKSRVKNGVIEIPAGVRLVEGQEVVVTAIDSNGDEHGTHGVLDIPTVKLGAVVRSDLKGDDLLGEMLEGRS
jgi:hypothetical protein